MNRCSTCGEECENQFKFCPIDGTRLFTNRAVAAHHYSVTIISDESLIARLAIQFTFLIKRFRVFWADFKTNPVKFFKSQLDQLKEKVSVAFARPYLTNGLLAAFAIILCVIASVTILDRRAANRVMLDEANDLPRATIINFQITPEVDSQSGVGAGEHGRVGFNSGRGEGSGPVRARSQGGGGGGEHSPLPASQGRPPVPSVIPAPIPTTYARLPPQALPAAGLNIDPVLWKDLPFPNYGDPRSKSTLPSNGPGEGGGVGTNQGTGIGEGDGPGFGPGRKGNIGDGENGPGCCGAGGSKGSNPNGGDVERIFRQPEVTTRARVLSKPEPQYTEEARRNQITGTVILSVVFSRTGEVTNIRAAQKLCCGLTEKAIAAARQIRFVPATRSGQIVSTYMQLEYNFNLY